MSSCTKIMWCSGVCRSYNSASGRKRLCNRSRWTRHSVAFESSSTKTKKPICHGRRSCTLERAAVATPSPNNPGIATCIHGTYQRGVFARAARRSRSRSSRGRTSSIGFTSGTLALALHRLAHFLLCVLRPLPAEDARIFRTEEGRIEEETLELFAQSVGEVVGILDLLEAPGLERNRDESIVALAPFLLFGLL